MESAEQRSRMNLSDKRKPDSNTIKARTISYDGCRLWVHLTYKFVESLSETTIQGDTEEEKAIADRPVDSFDINSMIRNLDSSAVRKLILAELGNNSIKEWPSADENVYEKENSSNIDELNQTQEAIAGHNIERSLYFRHKSCKLDGCQRVFLENKISMEDEDISTLSAKFKISKGALYNIKNKRRYCSKISDNPLKDNTKLVGIDKLIDSIDKIVMESTIPIKSRDIKDQLRTRYGIHAPTHKILWILKQDLRCSYK